MTDLEKFALGLQALLDNGCIVYEGEAAFAVKKTTFGKYELVGNDIPDELAGAYPTVVELLDAYLEHLIKTQEARVRAAAARVTKEEEKAAALERLFQ